eukprot:766522-Hanusia_phi.AAC.6
MIPRSRVKVMCVHGWRTSPSIMEFQVLTMASLVEEAFTRHPDIRAEATPARARVSLHAWAHEREVR